MAAADGDAVAAYNVTLNTLAGQGEPAEIFRALNISKATTAWPLSQEAACADYLAVNGQTLQQFEAQKAQRKTVALANQWLKEQKEMGVR